MSKLFQMSDTQYSYSRGACIVSAHASQWESDPWQWLCTSRWATLDVHQTLLEFRSVFHSLLNCLRLSVTHPAVWRSDGCSLQPVGSCSLQETHIKPRQRCGYSVVRTDCISLSYLPRTLDTQNTHDCRSREILHEIFHISIVTLSAKGKAYLDLLWYHTHLSDAGEPRFCANTSSDTPETHKYAPHYHHNHLDQYHYHPLLSKYHILQTPVSPTSMAPDLIHRDKHNPKSENPNVALLDLTLSRHNETMWWSV